MADSLGNQNMMVHSTNGVVDTTSNRNNDDSLNRTNNNSNIIDGAINSVGIIVSSSTSSSPASSTLPSSSSSSSSATSVHALPDSVMIPFCASDLDALRASLASNSINHNGVTSNPSSINVCINSGNIIVSAPGGAGLNQLTLDGSNSVMNGVMGASNIVANISSDLIHSNEITSNSGLDQRRLNLINNNDHYLAASSDYNSGNPSSSNNDNNLGSNISSNSNARILNKSVSSMNNGRMLSQPNPVSMGSILGNVSVDESGIISSNSFIPQHMNQGAGMRQQTGMPIRNQQVTLVNNAGNRSLPSSSNSRNSNHHLTMGGNSGSGGAGIDASRMIAITATANIHHHASGSSSISSNSNRIVLPSRSAQVQGVSSSANSSRENGTTIEVHAGPSHRQNRQPSSIWIQPDQTQYPSTSQSGLSIGGRQGTSSSMIDSQQGLVSISMGDHQLVNMGPSNSFQGQNQFSDLFQIPVQQGARSETFQAAAHSTFDQPGPSRVQVQYRDLAGDREATPSYPNIHHQIVSDNMVESLNSAPTVDSSTLHQSFNLVFDTEPRNLSLQRVISPSDSTVSQSTLSLEGSEATPNPALLPMVSQGYTMVQVNSMPPAFSQGGATGEVSTSSMGVVLGVEDRASSSGISSLDNGLSSSQNIVVLQKLEDSGLDDTTECDTTQEDIEFQHHQTPPSYPMTGASNSIDNEVSSLDSSTPGTSTSLAHRVIGQHLVRGQGSSSSGDVMDATLDSSGLTVVSMDTGQSVIIMEARRPPSSSSASASSSSMLHQHQQPNACQIQSDMPSTSGLQASDAVAGPSRVYQITNDPQQDENLPQSSGLGMHIRKSRRLELQDQEPRASRRKMEGSYRTQSYNPNLLWCDECMLSYDTECPIHRVSPVVDRVVLSRAWASCPTKVQICRLVDTKIELGESAMGVFAKRQIGKMTQFGPLVAQLVDSLDDIRSSVFPLMLELDDGTSKKYYDTRDENLCNWMMFIRPAKTFAEQNLVAFQHRDNIYFTVTKTIEAKQELKVWYAAHYAERLGLRPLELTEGDMQALDEEDARFPCFECSRRFKSSAALQKHLEIVHENEDLLDLNVTGSVDDMVEDDGDEDFRVTVNGGSREEGDGGGGGKRKGVIVQGKLIQGKGKSRGRDSFQWKKKSTNLYLSKTLKKYKKRAQCSDKTLQSMYTRQGKDNGGNEWVCTYCFLTFDKRSLLNIHTLTHAAEDLVAGESKMEISQDASEYGQTETNQEGVMSLGTTMACPKCSVVFTDQRELMNHVSMHAQKIKREKPFGCLFCSKSFSSREKLLKHGIVHGKEEDKPLECPVCHKRLVNNSALACHMKTHNQHYDCPLCDQDFDTALALKEHAQKHHIDMNGNYPCSQCAKVFGDFQVLKRHTKAFHSTKVFECEHCNKEFPRLDKLKLHMLKHTSHREFMCELCGRQFKRKDKLKEHTKRIHNQDRLDQDKMKEKSNKKFVPKVMPTEYHRFIYKCHTCLLGFKRRGMLVNHLAKRHPDMKPEHVPELNLPILKTQKDFYCQYCDKIYKSSSKRKAHILKIHPGLIVPPSIRKKVPITDDSAAASSNILSGNHVLSLNSFSHTVGSITTMPHGCKFCHKQYASKAKLVQHQRKKHAELVEPVSTKKRAKQFKSEYLQITVGDPTVGGLIHERYETVPMVTVVTQSTGDQLAGSADLLTQAMTEIQNYGNEFATINPRLNGNNNTMQVQIQPSPLGQTIDINQLNQALQSMTSQAGVTTVLAPPHASIITPQQQHQQHHQVQLVTNSTSIPQASQLQQGVQLVAAGGQGGQSINLNGVGNQFITTRAWPTSFTSQFS